MTSKDNCNALFVPRELLLYLEPRQPWIVKVGFTLLLQVILLVEVAKLRSSVISLV